MLDAQLNGMADEFFGLSWAGVGTAGCTSDYHESDKELLHSTQRFFFSLNW